MKIVIKLIYIIMFSLLLQPVLISCAVSIFFSLLQDCSVLVHHSAPPIPLSPSDSSSAAQLLFFFFCFCFFVFCPSSQHASCTYRFHSDYL